jgi:hypothetical protein
VDYVLEHGFIFPRTGEFTSNFIQNAIIASRMPWEYTPEFHTWYDWVSEGMDPTIAYWLVGITAASGWVYPGPNSHWPLDYLDINNLKTFFNGQYNDRGLTKFEMTASSYLGVNKCWDNTTPVYRYETPPRVRQQLKKLCPEAFNETTTQGAFGAATGEHIYHEHIHKLAHRLREGIQNGFSCEPS